MLVDCTLMLGSFILPENIVRVVCMQAFFEGVESLKAGGTKAEEVGYRLDFSRNELKKCIKEYPGKEVCCTLLVPVIRSL